MLGFGVFMEEKIENTEKLTLIERIKGNSYGRISLSFAKWFIPSIIVGLAVGVVGAVFGKALSVATTFRTGHPFMVLLLPIAGLLLVFVYNITKMSDDKGTNTIILAARAESEVKFRQAPLIFIATFITHLFGGSAGREGAALQIGGALVSPLKKLFKMDERDGSILIMCGMSAGFAALFGTPVASAVFAVEVTIVAAAQYSALVPCMISGVTSAMTAKALGAEAESFIVSGVPTLSAENAVQMLLVIVLGMACAAVSVLFCSVIHKSGELYAKYIRNPYFRVAAGGLIVAVLTVLLGTTDYNGAGMDVIKRAFTGNADPMAFLLKMLFTALTLGCGFKGGEIVPSFFVGATFGCVFGGLIGLDPSFGAAVGLIAVFCGVTNCPFASIILSCELFGMNGLPFYAAAIAISYMLSGYTGLYSAQKFHQSKAKPVKHHNN